MMTFQKADVEFQIIAHDKFEGKYRIVFSFKGLRDAPHVGGVMGEVGAIMIEEDFPRVYSYTRFNTYKAAQMYIKNLPHVIKTYSLSARTGL